MWGQTGMLPPPLQIIGGSGPAPSSYAYGCIQKVLARLAGRESWKLFVSSLVYAPVYCYTYVLEVEIYSQVAKVFLKSLP